MIHHCCDPRRRELVLAAISSGTAINGIDFIEVLDKETPVGARRQSTLLVRFLAPAPSLTLDNLELTGGERITNADIEWITRADAPEPTLAEPGLIDFLATLPAPENVLVLRTNSTVDYAQYTLRLKRSSRDSLSPPPGIDRILSEINFSFKVECPTDFDCAPVHICPEEVTEQPSLSYLAKDYQSFRRLMLGRMAQIMPDWQERSPADLGITLVEVLAYTADRLSYAQDAVATESYLATARRRSSIRRHARLVDYRMHDGANARAWVQVQVGQDTAIEANTRFLTRLNGFNAAIAQPEEVRDALNRTPLIFEAFAKTNLVADHNFMAFYEWGDSECCLPRGTTRATLQGNFPKLSPGDILIFEERLGPRTGLAADANPSIRHAVRLCAVEAGEIDELTGEPITELRWVEEDALPYSFTISSRLDDAVGGGIARGVSHALGNILLADHGETITAEPLGTVPAPHLQLVPEPSDDPCDHPAPFSVPPRFHPVLDKGPVTQAAPFDPNTPSAFAATNLGLESRRPAVALQSGTIEWTVVSDLLNSFPEDRHFVVETERDGRARLRFGDDQNGRRPNTGAAFEATYRIGNGRVGNVGAEAIAHALTSTADIVAIRNPLPATGGVDPESMEAVRQAAPYAYRRQERAVTTEDYARRAESFRDVQRAAATIRWNGHGHTVFVTVDRFANRPITASFEADLRAYLDQYRMAGYDLEVDGPRFIALEIGFFVCAEPEHFRAQVREQVLATLSANRLPDGSIGFFHPDNFTFGQPLYLSTLYAQIAEIEGVASVEATHFRRRGSTDPAPLADGVLTFGRLEIAQLENNPNFPERGAMSIEMGGGK